MNNRTGIIFSLLFLIAGVSVFIYIVPPSSVYSVFLVVIWIAFIGARAAAVFSGDRLIQFLTALFLLSFLTMQFLIGFNLINTILLASFIIGVGIFARLT